MEDGLARVDKRRNELALEKLHATLIERPVEVGNNLVNQTNRILQPDRQAPAVRLVGQPPQERQLVIDADVEPDGVLKRIDVVRLNRIATL